MKRARCDGAVVHAAELVVGLAPGSKALGKGLALERYEDGAVAWLDGEIVDAGPAEDVLEEWEPEETYDATGRLVTAGLVDAHTHLVWGGDRADEFARRLAGESYEDVAKKGGGILSTVRATRALEEEAMFDRACATARRMLASGTTTIEAKSGYELTYEGELAVLAIGHRVSRETWLRVVGTALSAHVVPPEYDGRRKEYVDEVVIPVAIEAQDRGHAKFVDCFVDAGAFTSDDARRIARATKSARLGLRLHVDQLRDGNGAALAAELGAASADHLDHASAKGLAALAAQGTVAVLTPGATLTLGGPTPDIATLRKHHVATAIATDWNPGTSTVDSLVLCLALACRLYRMTPEEVFVGATESAAKSLGLSGRVGCLRPGADADIVMWGAPDLATLSYHMGPTWVEAVWKGGRSVLGGTREPGEPSWGGGT
jgi:imidazolonepropionase